MLHYIGLTHWLLFNIKNRELANRKSAKFMNLNDTEFCQSLCSLKINGMISYIV